MTTPAALLTQLRDIHQAPPLSWWPPAPGIFVLTLLLLLAMLVAAVYVHRHVRRRKVWHDALKCLDALQCEYEQQGASSAIVGQLSVLLRRVALAYFPRDEVAGLHGQAWLDFLAHTAGTCAFTAQGRLLVDGPYQAVVDEDLDDLFAVCRCWIQAQLTQHAVKGRTARKENLNDAGRHEVSQ